MRCYLALGMWLDKLCNAQQVCCSSQPWTARSPFLSAQICVSMMTEIQSTYSRPAGPHLWLPFHLKHQGGMIWCGDGMVRVNIGFEIHSTDSRPAGPHLWLPLTSNTSEATISSVSSIRSL